MKAAEEEWGKITGAFARNKRICGRFLIFWCYVSAYGWIFKLISYFRV